MVGKAVIYCSGEKESVVQITFVVDSLISSPCTLTTKAQPVEGIIPADILSVEIFSVLTISEVDVWFKEAAWIDLSAI